MRSHRFSQQEMRDFVSEVWDVNLLDWQADDLWKFLAGGIFSYSIPTDHGKSMLIEMLACLRLCEDPNRRFIMVKINDDAAKEVADEVCRRLHQIATQVRRNGAPLFPQVDPQVSWRNGTPWGVGKGFDVVGRDFRQRNINPSFRSASVGSRDLQGKRGDTAIDDVERQEEASSEAYRNRLKTQVEAIIRTLEDKSDALWMMVGTAFHADSIYDHVTRSLDNQPMTHERIVRKLRNPDGELLWPERAAKVEVHRAVMSKTAFAAAYELEPVTGRPLSRREIEDLCRDPALPRIDNESRFRSTLLAWAARHAPADVDPWQWRAMVEQRLTDELAFYVGWDPATTGDWAVTVHAQWGEEVFVLRSALRTGDTWDQVLAVRDAWLPFPSAAIVVETNGQQKAFRDLAREDAALAGAPIERHHTGGINKSDTHVGLPALIAKVRQGLLHECFGDADWAAEEYRDLEHELSVYGPTSHPHLLVALWFGWHYHRRLYLRSSMSRKLEQRAIEREIDKVQIKTPRPALQAPTFARPQPGLREQSRKAWGRRHRPI